jgi:hypothetical protein
MVGKWVVARFVWTLHKTAEASLAAAVVVVAAVPVVRAVPADVGRVHLAETSTMGLVVSPLSRTSAPVKTSTITTAIVEAVAGGTSPRSPRAVAEGYAAANEVCEPFAEREPEAPSSSTVLLSRARMKTSTPISKTQNTMRVTHSLR